MTKRTTLFTITRKQWMTALADWLQHCGMADAIITDWDKIVSLEGGAGHAFFNTVFDTLAYPDTYPGRWFLSGQEDLSVYRDPRYLYSLMFGMQVVSGSVMATIGRREVGEKIWDIGGSIFTAYRLLQRGVKEVHLTNYAGPQTDFANFAAALFDLNVFTHEADYTAPINSIFICSEYLEHFRDVDAEIERLTAMLPARIYESSSFCMPAYGHYIPIKINGADHATARAARRAFYAKMKSLGYEHEAIPCFNRGFDSFYRPISP